MLTLVHCPADPGDKKQGIWWDSLLAMLGSSCLDYLKHPDWASSSLVIILVRISCVITSPWSERGTPHKATCNLSSNSDSTHSESSDSKKVCKNILLHNFLRNNICDKHYSDNCLVTKKNCGTKLVTILFILLKIFTREKTNFVTNNL